MPIQVVNVGMYERDSNGRRTTNITKGTTDRGTKQQEVLAND